MSPITLHGDADPPPRNANRKHFSSSFFVCFLVFCWGVVILVQIWLCFLCFGDSSGFESLKFLIIQITATAGLTVPNLINRIFQYIFDCLGKRSIMSISKIVAFGAQKIQSSSLRSCCSHNEWLFGADFGTVTSLGHISTEMSKELPLRSMASVTVPCSTNFRFQKLKRMTWTTFGFLILNFNLINSFNESVY